MDRMTNLSLNLFVCVHCQIVEENENRINEYFNHIGR